MTNGKNYYGLIFRALSDESTHMLTRATQSVRFVDDQNLVTHEGRKVKLIGCQWHLENPAKRSGMFRLLCSRELGPYDCAVQDTEKVVWTAPIFRKRAARYFARRPSRWRCLSAVGINNTGMLLQRCYV